ncbi:MAG TPA: hypothetical protein PK651_06420 [Smithellaceae bacterium]|nr:hypothetical protein [Smithellaceae bacterium]
MCLVQEEHQTIIIQKIHSLEIRTFQLVINEIKKAIPREHEMA